MASQDEQRRWIGQWQAARDALRAQRVDELAALSDEGALSAAEALLSIDVGIALPEARRTFSGLVHQQAMFHGRTAP